MKKLNLLLLAILCSVGMAWGAASEIASAYLQSDGSFNATNCTIEYYAQDGAAASTFNANPSSNSTYYYAKMNNDANFFELTYAGGFLANDQIVVYLYGNGSTQAYKVGSTTKTAVSESNPRSNTYPVEHTLAASEIESNGKLRIYRNSSNTYFAGISILRDATPSCAAPTINLGDWSDANNGYAVTFTNNEPGSTLSYKVGTGEFTAYTSGAIYVDQNKVITAKVTVAGKQDGIATLTTPEHATNTIIAGNQYIMHTNDVFAGGSTVTTDHVVLTFPLCATAWNKAAAKGNVANPIYTDYTSGTGTNGSLNANVPSGTYYQFATDAAGLLEIAIVLNNGKDLYVLDGTTEIVDFVYNLPADGGTTSQTLTNRRLAAKGYGTVTIPVEAGHTYYILCTGSKLGLYGFTFSPASVSLNAAGFATYSNSAAVETSGATVYKAAVNEAEQTITLTSVTGSIPANTGVILYGTPNTSVSVAPAVAAAGDFTGNDLKATSNTTLPTGKAVYALAGNEFKLFNGTALTPNKAYFQFDEALSAPMSIVFNEEITAVEDVIAAELDWTKPVFNILGQQVAEGTTGILIQNGVKFIVK